MACLAYQAWLFPVSPVLLTAGLIIYFLVLLRFPLLWLLVMPALCVSLNLAPWSGRFLFNEFDFFIFTSVLGWLGHYAYQTDKINRPSWLALLFCALTCLSFVAMSWQETLGVSLGNPYFSASFGVYVGKGILLALLLAVFLNLELQRDSQAVLKTLSIGAWIASLLLFVIVLWERNTLNLLFSGAGFYKVVNSFLDFATSYRTTGILADMHTGGESIDGWYLLLLPLNLMGFFIFIRSIPKLLALLAVALVLYAVLVGFTRATYFASGISLVVCAWLYWRQARRDGARAVSLSYTDILLYIFIAGLTVVLYRFAGFNAVVASSFVMFSMLLFSFYRQKLAKAIWFGAALSMALCVYIATDGYLDSQWVDHSTASLVAVIGLSALIAGIATYRFVYQPVKHYPVQLYAVTGLLIVTAISSVVLGGYRIQNRLETVSSDWQIRLDHWQGVFDSSDWDTTQLLLGNGWGSFPKNNLIRHPDIQLGIGSFAIKQGADSSFLTIGSGRDLNIGQRIQLNSARTYILHMQAKAEKKVRVNVSVCRRNLIVFDRWETPCKNAWVNIDASSVWQDYSVSYPLHDFIQASSPLAHPLTLTIRYNTGGDVVDINDVGLRDELGLEYMKNTGFERGFDHWFFYHDFKHLQWHIKNIYLSVFYQLGVLGSLLFFLMLLVVGKRIVKQDNTAPQLTICVAAMLAGYLSFGMFGDPLDSPRVSWLFYTLLFVAIAPRAKMPRRTQPVHQA